VTPDECVENRFIRGEEIFRHLDQYECVYAKPETAKRILNGEPVQGDWLSPKRTNLTKLAVFDDSGRFLAAVREEPKGFSYFFVANCLD
jgi:hypothetical protein